jgi:uncharacterized protein (TIGR03437 family)
LKRTFARLLPGVLTAALPILLFAGSAGPPIKRTGAAVDGGLNCTACHNTFAPANSDARGRVIIQAKPYVPGVKQLMHVRVEHPDAMRWGFELTARLASDETKKAGVFSTSPDVQVRCDDGSDYGSAAPCASGQVEFAMHTLQSTHPGTSGSNTWDIEWTPPSSEVGEIVFYAAGNAANNDNSPSGDRIYTTSLRVSTCQLTARPSVDRVLNGASFDAGGSPNAMVSVFGSNFLPAGQARSAGLADFDVSDFPTELACLAVEIGGKRAPITFLNDSQINVQVPVDASGPVNVQVIANPDRPNEIRGATGTLTLTRSSPAFFLFGTTRNIAALTVVEGAPVYIASSSLIPGARPARPGEIVSLYGTGFGPNSRNLAAGKVTGQATELQDPISVTIGGVILSEADVLYAGLSPGSITGLYQINVRVPSVQDGDTAVTVTTVLNGAKTQAGAFIPVKR